MAVPRKEVMQFNRILDTVLKILHNKIVHTPIQIPT